MAHVLAAALTACSVPAGDAAPLRPAPAREARVALPATLADARCAAVGARLACWSDAGACRAGCLVPSGLPESVPERAYLCSDDGEGAFACQERSGRAGPFVCAKDSCTQTWPALPSADEWQCMERMGALHCRRTARAAGVPDAPVRAGYLCGPRHGAEDELICVSFSPDVPDAAHTDCQVQYRHGGLLRVCRAAKRPLLGDACESDDGCPEGARCRDGACLPGRPAPSCWFDGDCAAGACVFGSCDG